MSETTPDTPGLAAGAAKVDITPPLTVPELGFYRARHTFFEGVHDPLYARALVVGDGEDRVALVSTDSIGFSRALPCPLCVVLGRGRLAKRAEWHAIPDRRAEAALARPVRPSGVTRRHRIREPCRLPTLPLRAPGECE